jgi:hypothetical protein
MKTDSKENDITTKFDKKKIATIVKSEDSENRIVKIALEETVLVVEYLSSWTEIKDLKGSVTKAAGMLVDSFREDESAMGGLILRCMGESLSSEITCLLSAEDIKRWIDYDFGVDELASRVQ